MRFHGHVLRLSMCAYLILHCCCLSFCFGHFANMLKVIRSFFPTLPYSVWEEKLHISCNHSRMLHTSQFISRHSSSELFSPCTGDHPFSLPWVARHADSACDRSPARIAPNGSGPRVALAHGRGDEHQGCVRRGLKRNDSVAF